MTGTASRAGTTTEDRAPSPAALTLAEIESSLALFVEAMAGEYLHIRPMASHPGFERLAPAVIGANKQTHEATQSRDSLYLPAALEVVQDRETTRGLYRVMAMLQLAYQEFGTFAFRRTEALRRLQLDAAETDAMRASDFTWFFETFSSPPVARALFELVERARVSHRMLEHYPGLAGPFKHYRPELPAEALAPLADALLRGQHPACSALFSPDADVYTSAAITQQLATEWVTPMRLERAAEPAATEWLQRADRIDDWQQERTALDANLAVLADADELEAELGDGDSGDPRPSDAELKALTRERDTLARRIEIEKATLRELLGADRGRSRSYHYDEWDYRHRRYLPAWCCLYEQTLKHEKGDVVALQTAIRRVVGAVRKSFEQLRPTGFERARRLTDGEELDWNALIEAITDRRAGKQPDDRVYTRRQRARRDVTCAFLIDLSASTDDPVDAPEPYTPTGEEDDEDVLWTPPETNETKRRIIDVLKEAVAAMAVALTRLGDTYAVYGFSGYGRDNVEFYVAKEADDPLDGQALNALAAMEPKRSTRMGPAIRHTTAKLKTTGAAQRLMIIISDGFPQDCDYGPERGKHSYGVADTAKALEEARAAGIETFCLTVDRSGHDYLKAMCAPNRYLVLDELEALPEALAGVYQLLAR